VPAGGDQNVAAGIGIAIEHNQRGRTCVKKQVFFILTALRVVAENAGFGFLAEYVF
jgi:hypothetical protein